MTKNNRQTHSKNSVSHLTTRTLTPKSKLQSKKLGVYQEYSPSSGTIPSINQSEMISDTLKYLNGVARRIKSRNHQDHKDKLSETSLNQASNNQISTASVQKDKFESLANYGIYNKTQEVTKHHVTKLNNSDASSTKILKLQHQFANTDLKVKPSTSLNIETTVLFDNQKDTTELVPVFKFVIGNQGKIDLSPIIVWKQNDECVTSSFLPHYVKADLLEHLNNHQSNSDQLLVKHIVQLKNFYSLPEEFFLVQFVAQIDGINLTENLLLEALDFLDLYQLTKS